MESNQALIGSRLTRPSFTNINNHHNIQEVRKTLSKLKQYFRDSPSPPLHHKNSEKTPNKAKKFNENLKQTPSYSQTMQTKEKYRLLRQNSELKQKLKKERKIKKSLADSLEKQRAVLRSFNSEVSFGTQYTHSIRQRKSMKEYNQKNNRKKINSQSEHQSTTEIGKRNHPSLANRYIKYNNTFQKQGDSKTNHTTHVRQKQMNYEPYRKSMQQINIKQLKMKLKKFEYQQKPQLISNGEIIEQMQLRVNQLMKRSQQEQNRAIKLKIRNQIGRLVSQMNKVKSEQETDHQRSSFEQMQPPILSGRKILQKNNR